VSFYAEHVYTRLVRLFGNPKPIQNVRRRLLADVAGHVLEIGFGPGVNLSYYDPTRVRKLYALEPNARMIQLATRHPLLSSFDVEFLGLPGEQIPLDDASVDAVVSTFTLCTLEGIDDALRGIARVLKPEGRLIFFENTVSDQADVRRWQERWRPIHQRVFAGLDLTRDIVGCLRRTGFQPEDVQTRYLVEFPKSWTCCCWGNAVVVAADTVGTTRR
jgi:SAM-dependent methyltransferase